MLHLISSMLTWSCSYNGTMYAVPLLGSGSSTAYQWSSGSSAWCNGYSQRYNSSSWSTAYIHQCAGSAWAIGNTIYQTNSSAGSEVAFSAELVGDVALFHQQHIQIMDIQVVIIVISLLFTTLFMTSGNIEDTLC